MTLNDHTPRQDPPDGDRMALRSREKHRCTIVLPFDFQLIDACAIGHAASADRYKPFFGAVMCNLLSTPVVLPIFRAETMLVELSHRYESSAAQLHYVCTLWHIPP